MAGQKTIVVIERNSADRAALKKILSGTYQVLEAEDGPQAMAVLEEKKDQVSLILLDISGPNREGYDCLTALKADREIASIPVIVTTVSENEIEAVSAIAPGATDFLAKPYKPQLILRRVASIISLRETAAIINQFQYDRLTGLYSKAFFCQQVKDLLSRNPETEYDIVCSDIENFKLVNDVFGTAAGDCLLQEIATWYTQRIKDWGICGRFDSDRFVCLIHRQASYETALFEQAEREINTLSPAKGIVVKWGIYPVEDRTVPVEQMCDRAFLAADSIKGQFGRPVAAYDDALRAQLLQEQAITNSMESALIDGQFEVYLQPKYTSKGQKLSGAEALVRWNHPQWGLQSPGMFVPLFEKNGFITRLDQCIWDRACAILKEWEEKDYPPIPISVNVSRADIYHADIVEILMRIVKKYGLPVSRLHLEITESAYTECPHQIIQTVRRLRESGFVVEMDDFGSGYSSLNMLNNMPIDVLKLDMKFIKSEMAKPLDRGILRFVMDLAGAMGLSVIAEGVETREQLEHLREVGCNYVQGYYFARPMPVAAFEELFRTQEVEEDRSGGYRPRAGSRERVLLVADEDPVCRQIAREAFGETYKIVEAHTADQVFDRLTEYGRTLSGVVLSLTLPNNGGARALETLQWERLGREIPVIAAAPAELGLEEWALDAGADDFITKPSSAGILQRRMERILGMSALQERERRLEDAAHRDYLTGLLNRRGMYAALAQLQEKDAPVAVYLFDMDNMKQINDSMGHSAGDALLKGFGKRLRAHTRESDIVARFGGDEFVAVLKQIGSPENALKKGSEICQVEEAAYQGKSLPVCCSAGVALWDGVEEIDGILQRADEALYDAKNREKNTCRLWRE